VRSNLAGQELDRRAFMGKVRVAGIWALLGTWGIHAAPAQAITPTVCVFPDPPCAGDTVIIEVSGMPDTGKWIVQVRYSKGGSDVPHDVDGADSTATQSNVPSSAGGGVMNVTVSMGGSSHTETFPVRTCP